MFSKRSTLVWELETIDEGLVVGAKATNSF
jgi:hypothetical protein